MRTSNNVRRRTFILAAWAAMLVGFARAPSTMAAKLANDADNDQSRDKITSSHIDD